MKVLIVDDSRRMRESVRMMLEENGSSVAECGDGIDAPAAYDGFLPDLVLMDVRMKVMDGISASRAIRARHPDACIVIVTDLDDDQLRRAARDAGAAGYVLKEQLTDILAYIK